MSQMYLNINARFLDLNWQITQGNKKLVHVRLALKRKNVNV